MKHVYTFMNIAFLFLTAGSAVALENDVFSIQSMSEVSDDTIKANHEFIGFIENYIHNPRSPFPANFADEMSLASIKQEGVNLSIQLISNDHFNKVFNPLEDSLLSADLISEGYFYKLNFLYGAKEGGVCENDKFRSTQSMIKINYNFPNIGYKTQVTKPVGEICGWINRDKTPSQDPSFSMTAQRNLFLSYSEVIAVAMNIHWGKQLADKTLTMSVENETLIYTLRDKKRLHPMDEKEIINTFFPDSMCQFVLPFNLLDIKVKFDIMDYTQANPQVIEKEAKQLCVLHIENIFNMK